MIPLGFLLMREQPENEKDPAEKSQQLFVVAGRNARLWREESGVQQEAISSLFSRRLRLQVRLPFQNKQFLFRSGMGVRSEMKMVRDNDVFPSQTVESEDGKMVRALIAGARVVA
jgi:hypothetical protein